MTDFEFLYIDLFVLTSLSVSCKYLSTILMLYLKTLWPLSYDSWIFPPGPLSYGSWIFPLMALWSLSYYIKIWHMFQKLWVFEVGMFHSFYFFSCTHYFFFRHTYMLYLYLFVIFWSVEDIGYLVYTRGIVFIVVFDSWSYLCLQ